MDDTVPDGEAQAMLDRVEDVVGRHLVRFGTRDELVVQWVRDDGSPGQRFLDDEIGHG